MDFLYALIVFLTCLAISAVISGKLIDSGKIKLGLMAAIGGCALALIVSIAIIGAVPDEPQAPTTTITVYAEDGSIAEEFSGDIRIEHVGQDYVRFVLDRQQYTCEAPFTIKKSS